MKRLRLCTLSASAFSQHGIGKILTSGGTIKTYRAITLALFSLLVLAACNPVAAPAAQPVTEPVVTEPVVTADPAAAEVTSAMLAALTATPWQWTQFADANEAIAAEERYSVTFNVDGTLAVVAGCNRTGGAYAVDGGALTIMLHDVSADPCAEGSLSAQFLRWLGSAGQFFAMGGGLVIALKDDTGTLSFAADATTAVDLCGEQAAAINPFAATLSPALSAALDQRLTAFLTSAERPTPGAVLLVITPAGRYFKAAGVADVTTCAPLTAAARYEIGSNTKLMTSAMILQLQEEGALSISDPIAKWVPELAAALPYGDAITIDMLLRHTSGLYDYFDVKGDGGPIAAGIEDKAMLTRAFTPVELVERVAATGQSYFTPEEAGQFHYSNTGYVLLGLIIEAATGRSYGDNLQARILTPLGLTQTSLLEGQPDAELLPHAYYSTPFAYTTGEWNATQGWSAGAVVSTAEEFAIFLKALFTGQLFREAATLDLMRWHSDAGSNALGPGMSYGRGMLDNNGVLGHGGQTLGFQSDGGYLPAEDVTIVMWGNSAASEVSRSVVPALVEIILGGPAGAAPDATGAEAAAAPVALPAYVAALQAAYGPPSQTAFGSAVFFTPVAGDGDLAAAALTRYRYFVGDLWERYGEEAWMGPWRQVYARPTGTAGDIVAELRGIGDRDAALSISMLLDNVADAAQARAALSAAFDDPAVNEVAVFNLGDGGAMSGLVVAGRRQTTGETIFLVFLLD